MLVKIVIASMNKAKLREISEILQGVNIEVVGLPEDAPLVEETGQTFAENAILKARSALEFTGLPALADDSGLMVDALDGAPGVYSARFASEIATDDDNNRHLIEMLRGVPIERRTARYVCVAALMLPFAWSDSGTGPFIFQGECEGRILESPQGTGGFGYDPFFWSTDLDACFGQVSAEAKHQVSHRGKAIKMFAEWMQTQAFPDKS